MLLCRRHPRGRPKPQPLPKSTAKKGTPAYGHVYSVKHPSPPVGVHDGIGQPNRAVGHPRFRLMNEGNQAYRHAECGTQSAALFAGGQLLQATGTGSEPIGREDPMSRNRVESPTHRQWLFCTPQKPDRASAPRGRDVKTTRDAMQSETRVGGLDAATIQFVHVDPATGKNTAWSFAISKASSATTLGSD